MRRVTLGALLVSAGLLTGCAGARGAKDLRVERWRTEMRSAQFAQMPVEGLPGGSAGVMRFEGSANDQRGTSIPADSVITYEYRNGSGPHRGYATLHFSDGSRLVLRLDGQTAGSPSGDRAQTRGNAEVVLGTGRYANVTGQGAYTGERQGSAATGVLITELTLNLRDRKK